MSLAGVRPTTPGRAGSRPPAAGDNRDQYSRPRKDITLAAGFAQLAVELYDAASMADTVDRVLEYALRATGCDCAGMVLVRHGEDLQTAAVTDRRIEQADRLQLEYGEGPCVPVNSEHRSVVVCDTVVDLRWPRWSPRVAELGLRSVLSVRLFTSRSTLGALNLYRIHSGQFTAADAATACLLARHAAVAVATAQQASMLADAAAAGTLIGQAQGLLMERYAIDADQALAVLRRSSQDNNIKLPVLADELVGTRRLASRSPAGTVNGSPPIS